MQPGPLGDMALGDEKAPVTIIEYASMTCPHCAQFHATTYPELKKRYIDTGKVRFIFREFPLDQLALAAFLLARCAGPDKYFPMIETLFQLQKEWVIQKPLGPLLAIAKQAGMSEQAFNECLQDKKLIDGIEEVRQQGDEAQRPVHPLVLRQRQAAARRLHDRGLREGDSPLYQGLIRVFSAFHRRDERHRPIPRGGGRFRLSFYCGIKAPNSFSAPMRHLSSTHPLGASPG